MRHDKYSNKFKESTNKLDGKNIPMKSKTQLDKKTWKMLEN